MKVTRKKWYSRVNETWPAEVPPLTEAEAEKAGKKLYRFVRREGFTGTIQITSGRRYNKATSYKLTLNPSRGWKHLVHDFSHYLYRGPHGGEHARLERRMIKEVLKRGWLSGSLKDPVTEPKPPVPRAIHNYQNVMRRLATWEKKFARAEKALKKLSIQKKYYERKGTKGLA